MFSDVKELEQRILDTEKAVKTILDYLEIGLDTNVYGVIEFKSKKEAK